jgi:ABC-2 type transport system permease protein
MISHAAGETLPRAPGAKRRLLAAYQAERRKLVAQTWTRVTALACLIAPFAVAFVLSEQSGVPADSLLGGWTHSSGYAIAFVVLDFAGYLGFPVLAGIVAGDLLSSEDRYGTWKTLLTRSHSRGEMFAAKVLAGFSLSGAFASLVAFSSLVGGLVFVGSQPLVGLSGAEMSSGEALALLLCSWLLSLLPLFAFVAIAILLSAASRSGIVGVFGTVGTGLLMQLLAFLGRGSWTHALLLSATFDDWHGLLAQPSFWGPTAIALSVSMVWIAAALGGAWLLLRRREFAGPPVSRLGGWLPAARLVVVAAIVFVLLSAVSGLGSTAITRARVQASVAQSFERLTILQQRELGRAAPAGAHLDMTTQCARRGSSREGPGDDWICTMTLIAAQPGFNPLSLTPVSYDVSVKPNGCYKADAPPSFIGQQTMTDARGTSVVNPLYRIYGCFDTTTSPRACGGCAPGPQRTTSAPSSAPRAPRPSPKEETRRLQRLHEAERRAGPKVIKEQEEAERYFEHSGGETQAAPTR